MFNIIEALLPVLYTLLGDSRFLCFTLCLEYTFSDNPDKYNTSFLLQPCPQYSNSYLISSLCE